MIDDIKVSMEVLITNQLDVSLIYTMFKNVTEHCCQTGIFQHNPFDKMCEVGNEMKHCAFMSRTKALDHMVSKHLDPESILNFLQELLAKDNVWIPSKRQSDTTKVPQAMLSLENSLFALLHHLPVRSNVLLKTVLATFATKRVTEHQNVQQSKSVLKVQRPNPIQTSASESDINWKRVAPKPGEPQSKMVNPTCYAKC
jgi:hypothetical protein